MTKVFLSYSHKQKSWVRNRLVPVLRAGGAQVLIDTERFRLGHGIIGEMDTTQDAAEKHVLCCTWSHGLPRRQRYASILGVRQPVERRPKQVCGHHR
jgi:hypothetical protein